MVRRRGALFSNTEGSRGGKLERRRASKAASGGSFHNKKKKRGRTRGGGSGVAQSRGGQLTCTLTYYKKKGTRRVEGSCWPRGRYNISLAWWWFFLLAAGVVAVVFAAIATPRGSLRLLLSLAARYFSLMAELCSKKGRFFSSVLRSLSSPSLTDSLALHSTTCSFSPFLVFLYVFFRNSFACITRLIRNAWL